MGASLLALAKSIYYIKGRYKKSDRINWDRQYGLGRTNSDRIKNKNKINLDSDQLGAIKKIKLNQQN